MDESTEYWRIIDYPPFFSNIDWNGNQPTSSFIPMEFDQQKIPSSYQNPPPFQRRRSSSVDLPINPLYLNSNRFMFGNTDNTIHEEEQAPFKVGSSATLEFPASQPNHAQFSSYSTHPNNMFLATAESPSLSTSSSTNNDEHMISPPLSHQGPLAPNQPMSSNKPSPVQTAPSPKKPPTPPETMTNTFFPELHRTSYNTILGKQLRQHQKRRRSSSLPPAFHTVNRNTNNKGPTPLIFTQIQVTDPTPIQHTQKAAKVDARPIAIERVHKKPQMTKPMDIDPIETQRKLDEELLQLNFDDVTVAELKEMLKERGLSSTGKKAVLSDRLKEARDQLLAKKNPNWVKEEQPTWIKQETEDIQPWCTQQEEAKSSSTWISPPIKKETITASPAIQGMADMSLHSPAPPVKMSFSPVDTQPTPPSDNAVFPQDYNYPSSQPMVQNPNDLSLNGLFDFETILDGNAILFPPTQSSQQHQQTGEHLQHDWDINWDQDKLDHFLTELV
ncbi:hypothetical protein BD560DRAFT_423033 [Blakeslea trispora]|nr:hypothetical protein BD560DRAFT_423033 [Blakeslea trispora]